MNNCNLGVLSGEKEIISEARLLPNRAGRADKSGMCAKLTDLRKACFDQVKPSTLEARFCPRLSSGSFVMQTPNWD